MTDLDQILPLWHDLRSSGTPYVLATVIQVEGSGYRKAGARMMIASDGRRAGTISGGCLEGEVARKAFWHTADGPAIRRYSTSPEDGEVPFGMGCGGVLHVLLERADTAEPMLQRLSSHYAERTALAIATAMEHGTFKQRVFWPPVDSEHANSDLEAFARQGYEQQASFSEKLPLERTDSARIHVEWNAPRTGLFIFGAGDDAIPLVRQARQLGWYVCIADGRSNLVTKARFPEADDVHALKPEILPAFAFRPTDAAAVMTHSLEQDSRILSSLLREDLAYIGVLGPKRRTAEILTTLAAASHARNAHAMQAETQAWLERLHAPMGLDLGGDTPAEIALSIIAEIQRERRQRTGLPLRQIRSHTPKQELPEPQRFSA